MLLRKNSRVLSIKFFQHEMKSERDQINGLLLTERFFIFSLPGLWKFLFALVAPGNLFRDNSLYDYLYF